MKCQILFAGKSEKYNLSSAEFALSVLSVKQ